MLRIPYEELFRTIEQAFLAAGLDEQKAGVCARVHADSSCDGVSSHGLNRVPRFIEYVQKGWVDVTANPTRVDSFGVMEIHDGHQGIGVTNALYALDRAAELAKEQGMGLVAMRNTTHWMRGGSYGWIAAEMGLAAIMWTNTESVMPAWGATEKTVGNNPMVMCLPRKAGPMVLDMAMSQYSYGKLQATRLKGEPLPYPGGFDKAGNLSTDPAAIEETRRLLPAGMWKGSGLAIMLDAFAAMLSQGLTGFQIDSAGKGSCTGSSQVFMVFDPERLNAGCPSDQMLDQMVEHLQSAEPVEEGRPVQYPGASTLQRRQENISLGVPVDDSVWAEVQSLTQS